ncbi:MAG: radical SAM protein [Desulfamplus sp.]|nr:radical SAM protein [Desulfamplus sp.]
MILIYPPVAKLSEPPPGVAVLAGALKDYKIDYKVIDANLEGMLWLAKRSALSENILYDRWSRRAVTHLDRNISDLKNVSVYKNMARYCQRIMDFNKTISISTDRRFKITLSDYTDSILTPIKSEDLLISAEQYMQNPFYQFFETHLSGIIEEFSIQIEEQASQYIGISVCYLSQALTAFALAGWIRARFPKKKIVMGGGLVTSWMSMPAWHDPFKGLIDCMVKGRGETALVNLCMKSQIESKQTFRPDFDFGKWENYIAPGRVLPFRTATGCYWNRCRFCPEKAEGNRYRAEKNSKLLDDLQYLVDRYNPQYVHFLDDAIPPSFLKALVSQYSALNFGLNKPNFKWYGFVRFTRELADPQFCEALYCSGCRLLKLGLESGDQAVLDKMDKGTDLTLASKILTCLKNAGIHTYVYLLFGTQFEDEAAANRTLDYVTRHSDKISFLNLAIFNLPRFSEDVKTLSTGMFSDGDLSIYLSFKHPSGWDRKKVRMFLDKKFKKHPAVGRILKNDPPFFTSNHAMFII